MIVNLLSYNIHKGVGWYKKQDTFTQLQECLQSNKPDFLFLQEIRGRQVEALAFDNWQYYSYGKNVLHAKGHYGNAILSQYPIIFSENFDLTIHRFEHRGFLYSVVNLPNNIPLHLLCVHLSLFKLSRKKQLIKIIEHIKMHIKPHEPIILAGDFNDWTSYATSHLIQELNLYEAFYEKLGAYARTFPAWRPLLKLDRIYYRGFETINVERLMEKKWRMLSDHLALQVELRYG